MMRVTGDVNAETLSGVASGRRLVEDDGRDLSIDSPEGNFDGPIAELHGYSGDQGNDTRPRRGPVIPEALLRVREVVEQERARAELVGLLERVHRVLIARLLVGRDAGLVERERPLIGVAVLGARRRAHQREDEQGSEETNHRVHRGLRLPHPERPQG